MFQGGRILSPLAWDRVTLGPVSPTIWARDSPSPLLRDSWVRMDGWMDTTYKSRTFMIRYGDLVSFIWIGLVLMLIV